jgi:hypothetical protein
MRRPKPAAEFVESSAETGRLSRSTVSFFRSGRRSCASCRGNPSAHSRDESRSPLWAVTTAAWTILSSMAAMPSGRCLPSAFGMYFRPPRLHGELLKLGIDIGQTRLNSAPGHSHRFYCAASFSVYPDKQLIARAATRHLTAPARCRRSVINLVVPLRVGDQTNMD